MGWAGRRKMELLLRLLSRGMEIWRCWSPLVMHWHSNWMDGRRRIPMDVGSNSVVVLRGRIEGHARHLGRVVLVNIPRGMPALLILLVQADAVWREGAVICIARMSRRC